MGNTASTVQLFMTIACVLMGTSHIVQPATWRAFFTDLHAQGTNGVLMRTFALEIWPALAITTLHQVWSGPGIVLTLYGWALLLKCSISLLMPEIGLRSLAMAKKGDSGFVIGGFFLIGIGLAAALALFVYPPAVAAG